MFRTNTPPPEPQTETALIYLAMAETPPGEPLMSEDELAVLVSAFESSGVSPVRAQVEVVSLDCGHWIQQEKPEETNQAILGWLDRQGNGTA